MAIRKVVTESDSVLRKQTKEVTKFSLRNNILLEDMADTMYEKDGVGLAAPQVGVLRKVFVVDIGEGLTEFINPEITYRSNETEVGMEGCLSIPGEFGLVTRPKKIRIKAFNREGEQFEIEAEGFFARAICHEYDHLDGQLYTDIMIRYMTDEEIEKYADGEYPEEMEQ